MTRKGAVLLLSLAATSPATAIDYTSFHTPAQVDGELTGLATANPGVAQIFTYGQSVEGLQLRGIKISDNVATNESAEGDLVFVALHHAREWLAAEMALYLADQLLARRQTDPALRACMDNLQIWVIPAANPDGYVHSASAPANRYWRKNRSTNSDGSRGVDLNRNYGYQWGMGAGGSEGSTIPMDETYIGPSAFSEPETAAFRNFVQGLANPKALVTYHTYSELFLRPWSYSLADPPGEPTLALLAQDSIARIASVNGHTYSENIWYNSFGETTDYFWHTMRLAGFTPELRPAPGGAGGFAPPASEIIPNNAENLEAALQFVRDAGCRRVWIKDHAADTGAEPSAVWTSSGWSHPFWESPDIWTVPASPPAGALATLNVRVHNDGPGPISGVTVRAYYTDPRIVLEFPNPANVLIGQQTVTLAPGDTTLTFSWNVPAGANSWGENHWCVGAVVSHPDDRPLTTQIQRTSNIGGKNFNTVVMATSTQTLMVGATNHLAVPAELVARVDRRTLPEGWEVVLPQVRARDRPSRKARLLGVKGPVLEPGETAVQPIRVVAPPGAPARPVRIRVEGALLPLVAGRRDVVVGNGYTFEVVPPKR